jgi:tetratricopeptide (TPR) repeat protein
LIKAKSVIVPDPVWSNLSEELIKAKLYGTATVACHRILLLSSEPALTLSALSGLMNLVDQGFSQEVVSWIAKSDFSFSDSDKGLENFAIQMNLYRLIYFRFQKNTHWADVIEKDLKNAVLSKVLFYHALRLFSQDKKEESITQLKEILKQVSAESVFFVKKVARTLARVYFEKQKYEEAYAIYSEFLLKTLHQHSTDWLEAAWCLFYLQRYAEALGLLYNFHSGSGLEPSFDFLEIVMLKSLIYQKLCSQIAIENLQKDFQKKYEKPLDAIKRGKSLKEFPELFRVFTEKNLLFFEWKKMQQRLQEEQKQISELFPKSAEVIKNLIQTELMNLNLQIKNFEPKALENAAEALLLMQENLVFMRFDVMREKTDPDQIFLSKKSSEMKSALPDVRIWPQTGSFWLKERLFYQGVIKSQCR